MASPDTRRPAVDYRLLFEVAPVGVLYTDGEGRILECNAAAERMLGWSRAELRSQRWQVISHPEDLEASVALLDEVRAGLRDTLTFEKRYLRRDGSAFRAQLTSTCVRDEHGGIRYLVSVIQDVEAQRRAESAREGTEARLRLLSAAVEQSAAGIVITDPEGAIIYVNRRFCESTGYSREEALGQTPRILKSGHHDDAFYRSMWETIASGREWRGEIHNRRKDGSLLRELVAIAPVHDEEGRLTHYLAVKDDVTELRALEQRLLQSQKLEAIGQLAGGIAHDFNNMLTAISGFGELLRPELPPGSRAAEYLDQITRAASRSSRLTSQLLAFSRRQILKPQQLDLNEVVREMEPMLAPLIGEAVRLTLDLAPRPCLPVLADRIQIEQVLLNLVLNARDAMPDGGTLRIETRWLGAEEGADERVELCVADSGVGIPSEVVEHIFEPFFTTKPAGRGTGLGLATVYGILRQSGAEVEVDSEPGRGARFRIVFPAASAGGGPAAPDERPMAAPAAPRHATILVVEDEAPVRQLVCRVLEKAGYRIVQAASGEEALRLAEAAHADLLLTDVVMPGISGRELATRLTAQRPDLPVLYMSGYTQDEVLRHGIQAGEVTLLEKPFAPGELLSTVRDALP